MQHGANFNAVDSLLQDLRERAQPFGGIVVLLAGQSQKFKIKQLHQR